MSNAAFALPVEPAEQRVAPRKVPYQSYATLLREGNLISPVFGALSGRAWFLFLTLLAHIGLHIEGFPTEEKLGKLLKCTDRAVRTYLRVLERLDLILTRKERWSDGSEHNFYSLGPTGHAELERIAAKYAHGGPRAKALRPEDSREPPEKISGGPPEKISGELSEDLKRTFSSDPELPDDEKEEGVRLGVMQSETPPVPLETPAPVLVTPAESAEQGPDEPLATALEEPATVPGVDEAEVALPALAAALPAPLAPAPAASLAPDDEAWKAAREAAREALAYRAAKRGGRLSSVPAVETVDHVARIVLATPGTREERLRLHMLAVDGAFPLSIARSGKPPSVSFIWRDDDTFEAHLERGRELARQAAKAQGAAGAPTTTSKRKTAAPDPSATDDLLSMTLDAAEREADRRIREIHITGARPLVHHSVRPDLVARFEALQRVPAVAPVPTSAPSSSRVLSGDEEFEKQLEKASQDQVAAKARAGLL